MISKRVYTIQFKRKEDFFSDLGNIIGFIERCVRHSIICTADLILSGFAFDRLKEASEFSKIALAKYLEVTNEKTLITSVIEEIDGDFYNNIKVIKNHEIIYSQAKTQLSPLNNEEQYMRSGCREGIGFFEIDGIKCAVMNCFELRFVDLWQRVRGAEVIFILAQWDKERKHHFEVLSQALAITNQCFVVASDCANTGMSKASSIINPFGKVCKDGKRGVVCMDINLNEVQEMRNFLRVGLEDNA
ncbi:nitrilase-related carbon-nitrogen hydrolase [Helicobacter cholecystus]|uniref:nitrilase-related carbon-nitrogen hydrolase n=1 Tax=Helicobacter cholecystus TaxID=45498 RepID=UPI002738343C|nr:nitrilase-related carbon-nitrogen hydrolase [Helicobacter cholecystus]